MTNLVPCKACGKQISSRATRCPHCGDPVLSVGNPFFISILLFVIGLALALVFGMKMCGS
jgi:hypothetical protein